MNKSIAGTSKIIIAMLIWSTSGLITRELQFPVYAQIFYAGTIGMISLSGYFIYTKKNIFIPDIGNLKIPLLVASFGMVLHAVLYFYAFQMTTIAGTLFSHYTSPVVVALISPYILGERLSKIGKYALVVSFVGMTMISRPESSMFYGVDGNGGVGLILGFLSGLVYAAILIVTRFCEGKVEGTHFVLYQTFVGFLLLCWVPFYIPFPNMEQWLWLLLFGVVHAAIAPLLFFSGLLHVKATDAAILGYVELVSACIIGYFYYKETIDIYSLTGGVAIVLSGILVIRDNMKNTQITPAVN